MIEFDSYQMFDPLQYLHAYYNEIGSEGEGGLRFQAEAFSHIPSGARVLDFGGGPTLYGLIPAGRIASEIHFCDYVPANRAVVEKWLSGNEEDFDWTPFIEICLQYEGNSTPSAQDIADRKGQIRKAVTKVAPCDVFQAPPVETGTDYDVIMAHYCLDAVTPDKLVWHDNIRRVSALLRPGGTLLLSSLLEATYSNFGGNTFPNAYLVEDDVREAMLVTGFVPESIVVSSAPADHDQREYKGVILSAAVKPLS